LAEKDRNGLRLTLRLPDDPGLADLPWEYLLDVKKDLFLAQSMCTPIVRYTPLGEIIKPLKVTLPLNVLVMISNPKKETAFSRLKVDKEKDNLENSLAPLIKDGKLRLTFLENARLDTLREYLLKEDYHVFHFIGHGGIDTEKKGVLLLEDELVAASDIRKILHDHKTLRLAVLNSCEGARFAGVAATLVRDGIPAVVAMQFKISDEAAITFATTFYATLAQGFTVDATVSEARKALCIKPDDVEWGTPVLYMRSPDGTLFNLVKESGDGNRNWRKIGMAIGTIATVIILLAVITQIPGVFDKIFTRSMSKNIEYKPKTVKYPKTLPSYLANTIGNTQRPFLYWFQFEIESTKKENVLVNLDCKSSLHPRLQAGDYKPKPPFEFEISSPGVKLYTVYDAVGYVDPNQEIDAKFEWMYRDKYRNLKEADPVSIKLLPKNVFFWDLTDGDGQPVPQDFLVASLSSWVLTADIDMQDARDKIRKDAYSQIDYDHVLRHWFEKWYAELFQGHEPITVGPHPFHMKGAMEIKTPSQVLKDKAARPLEAALLIAAMARTDLLKNESDARLILFVIPEDTSPEKSLSFILAWSTSPDKRWHAVKMCCASDKGIPFEENERHASGMIERLQNKAPHIFKDLEDKGVYLDKKSQILALDFEKARAKYQIAAMP
jgi:hypothetical protein